MNPTNQEMLKDEVVKDLCSCQKKTEWHLFFINKDIILS